jgi:hypothetical protein
LDSPRLPVASRLSPVAGQRHRSSLAIRHQTVAASRLAMNTLAIIRERRAD